ncbi:2-hydroxyacid dehydrogenase [Radicibacter daui]|uniref:2-hydroxyacid dehydrogenase n=1 Tax=Radicibacter daui TaxID=3064829 RepID=UPI0040468F89
MRIVFHNKDAGLFADWQQALAALLPGAELLDLAGVPAGAAADYAIVWGVPPEALGKIRGLKAIFSAAAGVDHLATSAFAGITVPVVRLLDAGMAVQMVDYSMFAALRQLRDIDAYEDDSRQGRWQPLAVKDRADLAILVLGTGELGGAVASALAAYGFAVTGWSRSGRGPAEISMKKGPEGLDAALPEADVVIALLPSTPDTKHLLDARRLALLKPGVSLVNLGRGSLIDEDALLAALEGGRVGRATLDVFAVEPLPDGHPFWGHPRITITPHVAAQTRIGPAARQIAENVRRMEAGEAPAGLVDWSRGY